MSNVIISLTVNRVDIDVAVSTPMLLILEQGFKIIKHILTKAHMHPLPNPNPNPLRKPNPLTLTHYLTLTITHYPTNPNPQPNLFPSKPNPLTLTHCPTLTH